MGLYNYRNKAVLDLPMTMAEHDPVNTRTLNRGRGGAALDAVWTAGATAPTKLTTGSGYYFDGGDRMDVAADATWLAAGTYTVLMSGSFNVVNGNTIFDASSGGGTGLVVVVGATVTPTSGTVYVNGLASGVMSAGNRTIAITGMTLDVAAMLTIGADTGGGNEITGNVTGMIILPGTLSPIQVVDWHIAATRHLHRI